jgi:hypothetical protein
MAQMVATGTLNGSVEHRSSLTLVFNSDPAGVALSGAASSSAALNFGTISMYGAHPAAGVTLTRPTGANSTYFTVSSPFDLEVNQGGCGSSTFNLSAYLSSPPGVFGYQVSGKTLSTNAVPLSQNDSRYAQNVQYSLSIQIPASAAAQTISNTIDFTATVN